MVIASPVQSPESRFCSYPIVSNDTLLCKSAVQLIGSGSQVLNIGYTTSTTSMSGIRVLHHECEWYNGRNHNWEGGGSMKQPHV